MRQRFVKFGVAVLGVMAGAMVARADPISLSNSLTGYNGLHSQLGVYEGTPNYQPTFLTNAGLSVNEIWTGDFNPFVGNAAQTIRFTNTGAAFGLLDGGIAGRNTLRTLQSGYHTVSFTAGITINNPGSSQVWLGIGTGNTGSFGVPDTNYFYSGAPFGPASWNDTFFAQLDGLTLTTHAQQNGDQNFDDPGFGSGQTLASGPMRVQFDYDASTHLVYVSADANYNGIFVADITSAGVNLSTIFGGLFTDGELSRIYIGAGSGAELSDFRVEVVPEPTTALLVAPIIPLILRRRR